MRASLFPVALALALAGSGCGEKMMMVVDAGPDTSCGLDCAAQDRFGLVVNRCFEYSDNANDASNPAKLGVWVREVFELEGGVKTIPLEYRQGGQIMQTDYLSIVDGDLVLMRRIAKGTSVTYKTGSAITGVKWLRQSTGTGETISTTADAFLAKDNSTTSTTYEVTTATPTATDKKTPSGTYDDAIKMIFGETPDHGSDLNRVWLPGTGFILISSPFNLSGGTSTAYSLQRIRDIDPTDAGTDSCSLGTP